MKAFVVLTLAGACALVSYYLFEGHASRASRDSGPEIAYSEGIVSDEPSRSGLPVVLEIRHGGRAEDIASILVKGRITIVDYFADWCGPCRAMDPDLRALADGVPGVYLRKVDIVDWNTPIVKQVGVRFVPNVAVYDTQGFLVGPPSSSLSTVKSYVRKALAKYRETSGTSI